MEFYSVDVVFLENGLTYELNEDLDNCRPLMHSHLNTRLFALDNLGNSSPLY